MAKKKSGLDASALPILLVILIPAGFFAYAWWVSNQPASSPAPQTQTQQTNAPQNVTQATISLNDAASLPESVAAAQLVPFSFTIQNTGSADGTIPYKVYVKWSTGEQDVIDENVASLAAGASTVVQEQLKFEIATETADVYLELTQTGQTSQFAIPRN
jgi:cell wall-associated NlpC family hydrolase